MLVMKDDGRMTTPNHYRCKGDGHNPCTMGFPKPMNFATYYDDRGYLHPKRTSADDKFVVAYNKDLLNYADCHCNVEIAARVNVIAYLYKYIYKGPDMAKFTLQTNADGQLDEIETYRRVRYLSAAEAAWRILGFNTHGRQPSVKELRVTRSRLYPVQRPPANDGPSCYCNV